MIPELNLFAGICKNPQVAEQPTDIGERQVADLGFLVERGLDLGKRVFQIPVLVGKGKRGADLFEARGSFVFSQDAINFERLRERQTAWVEARGRSPGEKGLQVRS